MSFATLGTLVRYYADAGVERIYVKFLAPNDNSKNQVYFGPGFEALNLFPLRDIQPDPRNRTFKAPVKFGWIGSDLSLVPAPDAQMILYPQYPEVRFSGFLKGAEREKVSVPRTLMTRRDDGRVLLIGVREDGQLIGSVFARNSEVSRELMANLDRFARVNDIFFELRASKFLTGRDPKVLLLSELCRIHRLGWIDSKRLVNGAILSCSGTNCGGMTLEAELGISANGRSEPDFLGWEVKQHSGTVLTLMTPQPTGGIYSERGVEDFIREYGYPDRTIADRLNFGGTHFANTRHDRTGLMLTLPGYDAESEKILDPGGGIALVDPAGNLAAFWGFTGIFRHWSKKHSQAVYVRSESKSSPAKQYRYLDDVLLCERTDPLLLVKALDAGKVYYDPGIKLENASTNPSPKHRSQFRVRLRDVSSLYEQSQSERVTNYCS